MLSSSMASQRSWDEGAWGGRRDIRDCRLFLQCAIVLHIFSTVEVGGSAGVSNRDSADITAAWQQVLCWVTVCAAAVLSPKGGPPDSQCQPL